MSSAAPAAWDRALGWALTGVDHPDWPPSTGPDLLRLLSRLGAISGGLGALRSTVLGRRAHGDVWPHPVPTDLRAGIGAAQFQAALTEAIARFDLGGADRRRVLSERPPGAEDVRLLREVPPHHG